MERFIKCRNERTRIELVSKYSLEPVAHVQLLNGQKKISCTGDLLTDSYYVFSYKKGNEGGTFFCGRHAANHFLNLLGVKSPPLFNPLAGNGEKENSRTSVASGTSPKKWNPISKQLYEAINILLITWDVVPYGPLLDIKKGLEKYYYGEPYLSKIEKVNWIISHDPKGRSIQEMISELRQENSIRKFDFSLLNSALGKNETKSWFG